MAIRVRKLAKELAQSPEEILGLLKALGFQKYKTPEDMLSDAIVEKVHGGIRDGVRPLPFVLAAKAPPKVVESAPARGDLMSQLVPGVVRAGAKPAAAAAKPATKTAPPAASRAVAAPEPAAKSADVAALESAKAALAAERAALGDAMRALEASRAALEASREAAAETVPGTPLIALLAERGLFGADEFERAVGALAGAHALRELLPQLLLRDPSGLKRVLKDRLVLVGGEPLDAVQRTAAVVAVAPDRAEVPDAAVLKRDLARVGEQLLLAGWRRVAIVGGRPLWHRVLREGLDPRVELRFEASPAALRDAEPRPDVVVFWGVTPPSDGKGSMVVVPTADLVAFLQAVLTALSAGS